MSRLWFLLSLFIVVGCRKDDTNEVALLSDSIITLSIDSQSKGVIVEDQEDMGSIGMYCSYTGADSWSSSSGCDKMDNVRFNFNKTDSSWEYDSEPLQWGFQSSYDRYSFFGYSPYGEDDSYSGIESYVVDGVPFVKYSVPFSSSNQPDLMVAQARKNIYPPTGGVVSLQFSHVLAAISFSIKGESTEQIEYIKIRGVIPSAYISLEDMSWSRFGESSNLEYNAEILKEIYPDSDPNISTNITTNDGYLMMIPQSIASVEIEVMVEGESEAWIFTFDADDEWIAGERYEYVVSLYEDEVGIECEEIANCYMIHPSDGYNHYYIPIDERINDFWQNYSKLTDPFPYMIDETTDDLSAEILWYDIDDISNFRVRVVTSGFANNAVVTPLSAPDFTTKDCKVAMRLTIPNNIEDGNIVVAIKLGDVILWSWHLWITDYNPDIEIPDICDNRFSYTLSNGSTIHRYEDEGSVIYWGSGGIYEDKFIMDRNLGSRDNGYQSPTCNPGALYYQFGRKDPFRGDVDPSFSNSGLVTFIFGVTNPTTFYTNYGNWCYNDDSSSYIWNDYKVANTSTPTKGSDQKSIFDPSPLGWRVPLSGVWNDFDINRNISWSNGADAGSTYMSTAFYPATGYRYYSSGYLYYDGSYCCSWAAEAYDIQNGYTLNISSNSMSILDDSYRARGRPVRPIQE